MGDRKADAAPVSLGDRLVCRPGSEGIPLANWLKEVDDGCRDMPGSRLDVDPDRALSSEGNGDGEVVMGDGEVGLPCRAAGATVLISSQSGLAGP